MSLKRILNLAAALAAVAAAAAVVIVAAAFAVYAFAREYLTEAASAAVVAAVFAVVALIVAVLATGKVTPRGPKAEETSVADRLMVLAKERPLVALGAAAAAVTVLVRNPAVITAVVSAFMAGSASKTRK
ncbi:hypothetical protein [uncultured Phenylobacterium sp.]|uniref:hypothetical protein n=1 Tax=uncultured Phenylobacterium sp. TaxID=349273 RepID=UPI0025E4859B|nr:hypothetical protein [uncultured Phenylobacterium sp.]